MHLSSGPIQKLPMLSKELGFRPSKSRTRGLEKAAGRLKSCAAERAVQLKELHGCRARVVGRERERGEREREGEREGERERDGDGDAQKT